MPRPLQFVRPGRTVHDNEQGLDGIMHPNQDFTMPHCMPASPSHLGLQLLVQRSKLLGHLQHTMWGLGEGHSSDHSGRQSRVQAASCMPLVGHHTLLASEAGRPLVLSHPAGQPFSPPPSHSPCPPAASAPPSAPSPWPPAAPPPPSQAQPPSGPVRGSEDGDHGGRAAPVLMSKTPSCPSARKAQAITHAKPGARTAGHRPRGSTCAHVSLEGTTLGPHLLALRGLLALADDLHTMLEGGR